VSEVEVVRRFNRTVTERAGALEEAFLGRDRSLGAARLLWEIGPAGAEVRDLRARLGLDSGYTSRLLRSLEADGLVEVVPSPAERRVRTVRPTAAGLAERAVLDARSDDAAAALLDALDAGERERLVAAMREVTRLLSGAAVRIGVVDPEHPDAQWCLREYFAELGRRAGTPPYDPSASTVTATPDELRAPHGAMYVVSLHGRPVGCGAVKFATGELKRMWLAPEARGLGLGRRLLGTLEAAARDAGVRVARLETSGLLGEAVALYRSAGWVEVGAFNDEPFADHWFTKELVAPG
jgi:DNA-binding MarR family transcriptional regulator/ribosomal protein S18 acetylase RimI-like enzyme